MIPSSVYLTINNIQYVLKFSKNEASFTYIYVQEFYFTLLSLAIELNFVESIGNISKMWPTTEMDEAEI